jgi:hypothetical protein
MTRRAEFLPLALAALLALLVALLAWRGVAVPAELETALAASVGAGLALTHAGAERRTRRTDPS